jgi:hypothetical protein
MKITPPPRAFRMMLSAQRLLAQLTTHETLVDLKMEANASFALDMAERYLRELAQIMGFEIVPMDKPKVLVDAATEQPPQQLGFR